MAFTHRILAISLAATFAAGPLLGAELRNSIDGRAANRTVSYEAPAEESAPAAKPKTASKSPVRQTSYKQAAYRSTRRQPVVSDPMPTYIEESPYMEGPGYIDGIEHVYCDDSCGSGCGLLRHTYGSAEFLLWWRHGNPIPALVTTAPSGEDPTLGNPNTTVLLGNETLNQEAAPGGRVTLGRWMDECECWAIEARYFALGEGEAIFELDSSQNPVIGRPFFNTDPLVNDDDAFLVAATPPAGNVTGSISVVSTSDVSGGDALFRRVLCRNPCWRLDLLAGYQAARIDERLVISSSSLIGATPVDLTDIFATRNEFHGGVVGAHAMFERGCWSFDVLAKVGFGNMRETLEIDGTSTLVEPGGLLAKPSNIGVFTREEFAVAPELGANITWHVNCNVDLVAGYSFLYWSEALTPGDQIDLSVNATQTTTPAPGDRPLQVFNGGDYWVHGINLGVRCRF